jgi:hypothetical protein
MLYKTDTFSTSLSGASLAQRIRRMTPAQRACLAANILDGKIILQGLTAKSVGTICGASEAYVFAALKCTPEQREAVGRGERSLVEPRTRVVPASATVEWDRVNGDELTALVRGDRCRKDIRRCGRGGGLTPARAPSKWRRPFPR